MTLTNPFLVPRHAFLVPHNCGKCSLVCSVGLVVAVLVWIVKWSGGGYDHFGVVWAVVEWENDIGHRMDKWSRCGKCG